MTNILYTLEVKKSFTASVTKVHELAGNSRNPKNGHFLGRHFSVCRFGQRNFPDDSAKAESLSRLSVILILFL